GKFVRRNALALGSASAVLLALLAGLAAATLGMLEAQRQFERAEARQQALEQVSGFQQRMLADIDARAMGTGIIEVMREQLADAPADGDAVDPALFEAIAARANPADLAREVIDRHMLERARETIEADFADQPLLQADLYDAVFRVYDGIGLHPPQIGVAQRMLELRRAGLAAGHIDVLQARRHLGDALFRNTDYEAARGALQSLLADLESRPRAAQDETSLELLLGTRDSLAQTLVELGEREAAIETARRNLEAAARYDVLDDEQYLGLHGSVGYVLARSGQLPEALEHFRRQAEGLRELLPEGDPDLAGPLSNLGAALAATGQLEEALDISREVLAIYERAYGRRHPSTLRVMVNIGNMLSHLDRVDEAIAMYEAHNAASREINGPDHPNTLRGMLNLASAMIRVGRPGDGLETVRDVAERRRETLGPEHLDTLTAQELHANALIDLDRHAEALPIIEPVHRLRLDMLGPDHPQTAAAAWWLGRARLGTGDAAGAIEPLRAAVDSNAERHGPEHSATITMAMHLFDALRRTGDEQAAETVRAEYLAALESADPETLDDERRRLREEWLGIRGE
ncbi:MAG: tetratricopeptide repeat protein, partial [Alphaproteobacteria bacterium]|nr:tetratricopeptide repeat protein [Alphaproteobacteria bacterium]